MHLKGKHSVMGAGQAMLIKLPSEVGRNTNRMVVIEGMTEDQVSQYNKVVENQAICEGLSRMMVEYKIGSPMEEQGKLQLEGLAKDYIVSFLSKIEPKKKLGLHELYVFDEQLFESSFERVGGSRSPVMRQSSKRGCFNSPRSRYGGSPGRQHGPETQTRTEAGGLSYADFPQWPSFSGTSRGGQATQPPGMGDQGSRGVTELPGIRNLNSSTMVPPFGGSGRGVLPRGQHYDPYWVQDQYAGREELQRQQWDEFQRRHGWWMEPRQQDQQRHAAPRATNSYDPGFMNGQSGNQQRQYDMSQAMLASPPQAWTRQMGGSIFNNDTRIQSTEQVVRPVETENQTSTTQSNEDIFDGLMQRVENELGASTSEISFWFKEATKKLDLDGDTPPSFRRYQLKSRFLEACKTKNPATVEWGEAIGMHEKMANFIADGHKGGEGNETRRGDTKADVDDFEKTTRKSGIGTKKLGTNVASQFFNPDGKYFAIVRKFGQSNHEVEEFWQGKVDPCILFLIRKDPDIYSEIAKSKLGAWVVPILTFRRRLVSDIAARFAKEFGRKSTAIDDAIQRWAAALVKLDLKSVDTVAALECATAWADAAEIRLESWDVSLPKGALRLLARTPAIVRKVAELLETTLCRLLPHDISIGESIKLLAEMTLGTIDKHNFSRLNQAVKIAVRGLADANEWEVEGLDVEGGVKRFYWTLDSSTVRGRQAFGNVDDAGIAAIQDYAEVAKYNLLRIKNNAQRMKPEKKDFDEATEQLRLWLNVTTDGGRSGSDTSLATQGGKIQPAQATLQPIWNEQSVDGINHTKVNASQWPAIRDGILRHDASLTGVCVNSVMFKAGCTRAGCQFALSHANAQLLPWNVRRDIFQAAGVVP